MKKGTKRIEIGWRLWSLVIISLIFISVAGFSYSYGTSTPEVFGHSADEIEGLGGLKNYDTGWVSNSDWTNQHLGDTVGGNVVHNLNAPLSNLSVKIFVSTGGAVNDTADLDAHSFLR